MNTQTKLIGRKATIIDNSYAFKINKPKINPMLALTSYDCSTKPIVKIVSEPYILSVDTIVGIKEYEFITVEYKRCLSVVLNCVKLID